MISKQVNSEEELVKNLINDLDGTEKNNRTNNIFLNNLGQEILEKTMTKVNNFILSNKHANLNSGINHHFYLFCYIL